MRQAFEHFSNFSGKNNSNNPSCITFQDLRRVADELKQADNGIKNERNQYHLSDEKLRAMIDEFDRDQDGCINFDEFRYIMTQGQT